MLMDRSFFFFIHVVWKCDDLVNHERNVPHAPGTRNTFWRARSWISIILHSGAVGEKALDVSENLVCHAWVTSYFHNLGIEKNRLFVKKLDISTQGCLPEQIVLLVERPMNFTI